MTKRRQRTIEVLLFLVIAMVGFAGTRRVLIVLEVERAKAEIAREQAQERRKPAPFVSPFVPEDSPLQQHPEPPFQFGPPSFKYDPNAPNLFDLPYTTLPPEPGSLAWYNSLPPIPPCNEPWDIWREPQCQRVSNYI